MVAVKPARAGVRVLCLDGGGVRGIAQLRVLREIERVLGPGLPIQLFFDLMVGTK
jgi:patatin-like phospholipase/acyl hydrolase